MLARVTIVAVLLAGCAEDLRVAPDVGTVVVTRAKKHVLVTGRYASSVSAVDVEQIARLLRRNSMFGDNPVKLDARRNDWVRVETRLWDGRAHWIRHSFFVSRQHGTWDFDENSSFDGWDEVRPPAY